jgi:hypothetical protein
MKRSFLILFAGVVGILLMLILKPKQPTVNQPIQPQRTLTNNTVTVSDVTNTPTETAVQTFPNAVAQTEPQKNLNAMAAQNIADWTNAIPHFKQWSHFRTRSSWVADQGITNNYPIILLTGANGNTLQFTTKLTSVDTMSDHIRQVELQSPFMNIEEIKNFGQQLCALLDIDPKDFLAWCNQVGNTWVDQPIFYSGAGISPDPAKAVAFNIRQTFNNEKPWYIDFVFTDR